VLIYIYSETVKFGAARKVFFRGSAMRRIVKHL